MPSQPAIIVNALHKSYGDVRALAGIDLEIPAGSFFGLLGPNGAGKSTLIHVLTGLASPTSGTASVFGQDVVRDYRKTRRLIGIAPQEFNFDRFFSILDLLVYQGGYFGMPKKAARKRAEELLARFGLWEKRHEKSPRLSGGMKRRLLIAKAMIHDPPILILDEPTAGVDVALRRSLWELVREVHARGTTVVLTTHYLDEAEELCDRVGIIHRGAFVALDRKEALMHQIQHRKVTLEFTAPLDRLPEDLARLGAGLEPGGRRATLLVDRSNGSLQHLVETLGRGGLSLSDIQVEGAGLEDVFLQLTAEPATGGGDRSGAPA